MTPSPLEKCLQSAVCGLQSVACSLQSANVIHRSRYGAANQTVNFFRILQSLSWRPPADQKARGLWVRDCDGNGMEQNSGGTFSQSTEGRRVGLVRRSAGSFLHCRRVGVQNKKNVHIVCKRRLTPTCPRCEKSYCSCTPTWPPPHDT